MKKYRTQPCREDSPREDPFYGTRFGEYVLIALAIKLICWGVAALFSKKHHHGAIGTLDTAAGFLLGFGLGIFYALLLLALLALLISVCSPGTASSLSALMKGSYISENLYRMNPLLSAFRSVLG